MNHRVIGTLLGAMAWIGAVSLQGGAAALPDFAVGLTCALVLCAGLSGWLAALSGWLAACSVSLPMGLFSDPIVALAHFAGCGALIAVGRFAGAKARPEHIAAMLAAWGVAACTIACNALLLTWLRDDVRSPQAFAYNSLHAALTGMSGVAVVLPCCWLRPISRARENGDEEKTANAEKKPGAGAALAVLPGAAGLGMATLFVSGLEGEMQLAVFALASFAGAIGAALCTGLRGVVAQGLLQACALLWLAHLRPPAPSWLALFAAAQIVATLVACAREQQWRLAARQRRIDDDIAQRQRFALYQLIADHSPDIISVHAHNFDFCYASPQLHRLLGLASDEQPGPIAALLPRLHPADRPANLPESLPAQGRYRFRIRGGDHHWHWLESIYAATDSDASRRYVVITRDIGSHVEQTESLHAMALHDPMTQLYNRRAAASLGERLWEEALAQRMPFAVVMLDIDHFKRINDTYGHDVGDDAIKQVASILPAHVRQRDMVCRWGGEEFLMLLPESDAEGAYQIAERVRGEVASTALLVNGERVPIRISAGVTERIDGDASLAEVIERADQGLYAAKEQGRNRVVPMRKIA